MIKKLSKGMNEMTNEDSQDEETIRMTKGPSYREINETYQPLDAPVGDEKERDL